MALELIQINGFPETSALLNWLVTAGSDGEGKKISLDNVKAELGIDALMQFGGAIVPASTPEATGDYFWIATEEGTYTNFGGVVVPAASMAVISRIDGVFTSSITTIPQPENKIETWEAGTYVQGDQRIHNGQIWSVDVASTTEEPGTGTYWIGDIDKIGEVDLEKLNIGGSNLFDKNNFRDGQLVNTNTGLINHVAGYQTTMDIIVPDGETDFAWSGLTTTQHRFAFYSDEAGTFISAVSSTESAGTRGFPTGTKMFRSTFRHPDDTVDVTETFMLVFGDQIPAYEPTITAISKIKSEPIAAEFVAKDPDEPKNPISLEYFNENVSPSSVSRSEIVSYINSNQLFDRSKNLIPNVVIGSSLNLGFIQNTGTDGAMTVFFRAKENTPYMVSGHQTARSQLAFLKGDFPTPQDAVDNSNILVSGDVAILGGSKSSSTIQFTTVADTTWVALVVKWATEPASVYDNLMVAEGNLALPFQEYSEIIISISDKGVSSLDTLGKEVLIFGDSITETENINGLSRSNWPVFATSRLGWEVHNYAKSGAGFVHTVAPDYPEQWLSVQIDHAETDGIIPDIVVVSLGTNDLNDTLGSYDVAMGKTIANLDMTIAVEAARANFYRLRELYPDATFYYALPIQRASAELSSMLPLIDELRKMAQRYGFVVIEATYDSGIIRDFETVGSAGRYLYDGLHPNQKGQKAISDCYVNRIIQTYES